jgi:hypothetical protein
MAVSELVRNELLCFLQQKSTILMFDDLVSLATDFYSTDEIKGKLASVYNYVDHRIPAYKGADKDRKIIADLLKLVLNPDVKLPTFVALDLTRLPPVDVDHIDLSALLKELTLLRSEVRGIGMLRAGLDELKSKVNHLQQAVIEPDGTKWVNVNKHATVTANRSNKGTVNEFDESYNEATSYAAKAQELQRTGMKKSKPKAKLVTGSSTLNKHVKCAETVRTVDMFVSRLDPHTTGAELVDCVNSVKGDLVVTDVKCSKLNSKYEHLYTSFHVAISVSSSCFHSAINLFASAESWPMGIFVKRYFKTRNVDDHSSS